MRDGKDDGELSPVSDHRRSSSRSRLCIYDTFESKKDRIMLVTLVVAGASRIAELGNQPQCENAKMISFQPALKP